MKTLLRLEELAMFLFSVVVLFSLSYDATGCMFGLSFWSYLLAMLIAPDISMLGYLVNNKVGAWSYNLFHHKGVAVLIWIIGLISTNGFLFVIALVIFGHSSMDRFFGFGLKTEEGFKFTHLGKIGKE